MEEYYFKTLHGCFSHFLNYTNGTKSRKASYRKSLIGAADWLELFLQQFHNQPAKDLFRRTEISY